MRKRILSIVMMLSIALSLAIGTALVADATDEYGSPLGVSANLADSVTVQAKFNLPANQVTKAEATLNGQPVEVTVTADANDALAVVPVDVPVKDIDKPITVTVYDATTSYTLSELQGSTLTAKAYLATQISDATYGDLAKALISYGETARKYFANETLSAPAEPSFAGYTSAFKPEGSVTGINHRSCTLFIEEKTVIRYYFTVTEGAITDYTFEVDGVVQAPTQLGDRYYVEKTGITPLDLATAYQVKVTKGEEAYTCKYSAIDYAQRAFTQAGTTDARKAISAELYSYYKAADELPKMLNITYVTNGGTITSDNHTTEFLEGTSDGIQLPTVYMGEDIFEGWYTDEAFTEKATPAVLATKGEDITLYANRVNIVTSTSSVQQHYVTADLSDTLKDGGYLTYSFVADPSTVFSSPETPFGIYLNGVGNHPNASDSSKNSKDLITIQALWVQNGKIYTIDEYGYGAGVKSYNQIGTFAEGTRIDMVLHFDLRNIDRPTHNYTSNKVGYSSNNYATISLEYYVNGVHVQKYTDLGYDNEEKNKNIGRTWYYTTDGTPAAEGAPDDGYNIDPETFNYTNDRIFRLYYNYKDATTDKYVADLTSVNDAKYDMTIYSGKYIAPTEANESKIFYNVNGGEMSDGTYDETFTTGNASITLPKAIHESKPFVGWCFDKECKIPATPEAIANQLTDVTLFAKYAEVVRDTFSPTRWNYVYKTTPFDLPAILDNNNDTITLSMKLNNTFVNSTKDTDNQLTFNSMGDAYTGFANTKLRMMNLVKINNQKLIFGDTYLATLGTLTQEQIDAGEKNAYNIDLVLRFFMKTNNRIPEIEVTAYVDGVNAGTRTVQTNWGARFTVTDADDFKSWTTDGTKDGTGTNGTKTWRELYNFSTYTDAAGATKTPALMGWANYAFSSSPAAITIYGGDAVDKGDRTHNIAYNANGGEITDDTYDTTFTTGKSVLDLPATAVKENDYFVGWYFDQEGTVKATPELVSNYKRDITLYAKYLTALETSTNQKNYYHNASNPLMLGDAIKDDGYVTVRVETDTAITPAAPTASGMTYFQIMPANGGTTINTVFLHRDTNKIAFDKSSWVDLGAISEVKSFDLVLHYTIDATAGATITVEMHLNGSSEVASGLKWEQTSTLVATRTYTDAAITSFDQLNFNLESKNLYLWNWGTNLTDPDYTVTIYDGNIYG